MAQRGLLGLAVELFAVAVVVDALLFAAHRLLVELCAYLAATANGVQRLTHVAACLLNVTLNLFGTAGVLMLTHYTCSFTISLSRCREVVVRSGVKVVVLISLRPLCSMT